MPNSDFCAFMSAHGLAPHHDPFAQPVEAQLTLLSAIARRREVGPYFPLYYRVPDGYQARILCQAVGVLPSTLRSSLSLDPSLFDSWLRDETLLSDDLLPHGVTLQGIRHVFGAMEHIIARGTTQRKEYANAS